MMDARTQHDGLPRAATDEDALEPEPPASGGGALGAWMFTFTDLVLLLLTFFVMMFAMSSPRTEALKAMAEGLSTRLGPLVERPVAETAAQHAVQGFAERPASDLGYLRAVIEQMKARDPGLVGLVVRETADRLILSLPSELLFAAGDTRFRADGAHLLAEVGNMLSHVGNRIAVAGHAEADGLRSDAYVSTWELSLGRAAAVAHALRRSGYPDDIEILGYADTRTGELAGLPDTVRHALARRVDVVVLPGAKE